MASVDLREYDWPRGKCAVYIITNGVNGKRYVGVTRSSPSRRKSQHFNAAKAGKPTRIAAAIRKYGKHNFLFNALEVYEDYVLALTGEMNFIAFLQPEYNVTSGGDAPRLLYPVREETREKLSVAARGKKTFLGKKHTKESIDLMRVASTGKVGHWRGKSRTDEVCRKISTTLKGKPGPWLGKIRSEETKRKISATKKGCAAPPESDLMILTRAENMRKAARAARKRVECVTDGRIFESISSAAVAIGANLSNVSAVARGKKLTCKGFELRFVGT